MNNFYYGGGTCSVSGDDIIGVWITYTGAIEIDDKTPNDFCINASDKNIWVNPYKKTDNSLNDLFNYVGFFDVTGVSLSVRGRSKEILKDFKNSKIIEPVPVLIKRVIDYSEALESNAEDLTILSENLSTGKAHGRGAVGKTILKQPTINNLHTSESAVKVFDSKGVEYVGFYHIHITEGIKMSGGVHTERSFELKSPSDPKVSKRVKERKRRERRRR